MTKLNLGSGFDKSPGYVRVDVAGEPEVWSDARALPFQDGAFSEVKAHHVLEHIPREALIGVMNECWRVTEPGGRIDIEVPVFPYWTAIADPTHISFFVSQTFDYFSEGAGHDDHMRLYGIKPWRLLRRTRMSDGQILGVEMEKVA